MRAAIYEGPYSITVGERPDPVIETPSDAVVRVVMGCVCGSDLWYYRGDLPHTLGPIGHCPPYIPDLLEDVLEGRINPGRVLDYETDLDGIPEAYEAMNDRRAIKAPSEWGRRSASRTLG